MLWEDVLFIGNMVGKALGWGSLNNQPNPPLKDWYSKNFPTDPWSIPQTPNQQFMKEFLSFGGFRGMLGLP